ncbi:hypothetical protein QQ045_032068 [Rhodiola kirilowii]
MSEMGMSYEEKIALSRKVMMAGIISFLAATVLIILLHFYTKYLLMRQERMIRRRAQSLHSFSSDDVVVPVDDQISLESSLGLDALIIASLPKFAYGAKMNDSDETSMECSVCLSAVCGEDMVRMLPNCKHLFHLECIDKWLGLHTTCPICRTAAEPRSSEVAGSARVEVGSASVALESSQSGSNSLLSSFRKLVGGERSSGRVQSSNDVESE